MPNAPAVAELPRRLGVVPEPPRRRRDLDAAHEVQPRELLDPLRAQVRHAARRDVGVVVQEDRQAPIARVEQVGHVARDEADGIVDVADRERRDHARVRADLERELQRLERLGAGRRR